MKIIDIECCFFYSDNTFAQPLSELMKNVPFAQTRDATRDMSGTVLDPVPVWKNTQIC